MRWQRPLVQPHLQLSCAFTGAGEVYIDPDHLLDSVDKDTEEASYFVDQIAGC